MNIHRIDNRSALRGYISAQLAIVLAIILGTAGILIHEWHAAHPSKHHAGSTYEHRHPGHVAAAASH